MISGIQWVSELIEIAGGQDVFEDRKAGKLAKDRFVTSEEVIAADPEVFLASWCGKPFDRAQVESRKGWSTISALQTGRIHEIDACKILQPGPACLTDGLEALETAIHT
jgi:iron complex transport system substrate-binding protein